ncbi:MAG: radical SAM protein, partial [Candidatus Omnitrophota bacterium]
MMNKCLNFLLAPLKIAKMAYFNTNKFRYWLHKKTGMKFQPKAPKFPPMIIAETSSYCDLLCLHCPRTTLARNDASFEGFMDFDLWKKIVDEIAQYKHTTLRPFGRGEALINPDFVRMIQYAKEKGVGNVWLNTNGLLLSPEKSKDLLNTRIDVIEISIDAASRDTFEKIKGKDVYDTVVENTIACCRQKKESHPKTKIVVRFVESSLNTPEKDAFLDFWKDY